MTQELVKIITDDKIELAGVIYKPLNETKKIIVHVHGLSGNFYENSFLDFQANSYTENNYAYLTFNNRGNGYFTDLIKKDNGKISFSLGGSVYELIEDSYSDIKAAIDYVKKLGYDEIILQGHSFGCNKVIYYYNKIKDDKIKKIILLAPCDMIKISKCEIKDKYNELISKANILISEDKKDELIGDSDFPFYNLSATTFLSIYTENCDNDIFRYRIQNYKSEILNNINIPVLVQIGTKDEYLTETKETIINYFKNNIKMVTIHFIEGSNHGYINKEQEMCDSCIRFLNSDFLLMNCSLDIDKED